MSLLAGVLAASVISFIVFQSAAQEVKTQTEGGGGSDGVGDDIDVTPDYPASYSDPNIISVAAMDDADRLATFSNYGA